MREEREKRNLENERLQLTRDLERVECELPYEAECLLLAQTIQYLHKIIDEPNNASKKEKTDDDDTRVRSNRSHVFCLGESDTLKVGKQLGNHV